MRELYPFLYFFNLFLFLYFASNNIVFLFLLLDSGLLGEQLLADEFKNLFGSFEDIGIKCDYLHISARPALVLILQDGLDAGGLACAGGSDHIANPGLAPPWLKISLDALEQVLRDVRNLVLAHLQQNLPRVVSEEIEVPLCSEGVGHERLVFYLM